MTIVDCILLAEVDMIYAGVVGLLALIVLVTAILSAKHWHWVNVVFLILTLIASITAIIGMTFAFQHRREGLVDYKKALDQAERAEADLAEVIGGDPLSVKYGENSLRYNSNQLALAMTGRGRALRGVQVAVEEDGHKFALALEEKKKLRGAILYAFADSGGYPDRYIGSMLVAARPGVEDADLADNDLSCSQSTWWT